MGGARAGGDVSPTMLWYLDDTGELDAARVRTGLTNGQTTVVEGRGLEPGIQVIVGISQNGASSSSSSPFQSQQQTKGGLPRAPGS